MTDDELTWIEDMEREAAEVRHWERLGLLCYPDCQVWDGAECEACPVLIGRRASRRRGERVSFEVLR